MWRWDQAEPFGNNPADEDPDANSVAFDLPLRLPGQRYDKETGLAYNMARDYSSETGRYVQSDPIGLQGGLNTYAYVGSNPLSFIDLDGLQLTRGNRERGERAGRERPEGGASSVSQSASSTSSVADRQFCYALCMQRENDRNLRSTVLSCGVITAAAVAGAVLSGGTASPISALAICAFCTVGIGAGLTLSSDSKCRRDCGLDRGIADQLTQPRQRGGGDPLSLQQ